jgi:nicotinate-nucleotide--dimethylbenzimidazole phosphoribosyltransferase
MMAAITPASAGAAARARARFEQHDQRDQRDQMEELAARLAGARHTDRPALVHKHVIICAADHGAVEPHHTPGPAVTAVKQVIAGRAAINKMARTAGAAISVVDCGLRESEPLGAGVMDLRVAAGTADIRLGPAMSADQAVTSVQTGIALMLSLADAGADCVALGQIAPGSEVVSAALVAALAGPRDRNEGNEGSSGSEGRADPPEAALEMALGANAVTGKPALEVLAALGGYEIGVMAGLVLAAASLRIPVVLDDHGTSAAALVAARLAPAVTGYLFASQAGNTAAHRRALATLGLHALFDLGLAHGEGTGAALALPILDSVARVLCED